MPRCVGSSFSDAFAVEKLQLQLPFYWWRFAFLPKLLYRLLYVHQQTVSKLSHTSKHTHPPARLSSLLQPTNQPTNQPSEQTTCPQLLVQNCGTAARCVSLKVFTSSQKFMLFFPLINGQGQWPALFLVILLVLHLNTFVYACICESHHVYVICY